MALILTPSILKASSWRSGRLERRSSAAVRGDRAAVVGLGERNDPSLQFCETGHSNPNNLTALSFKIPGITSGLKPATSKSFIQRSGVIRG